VRALSSAVVLLQASDKPTVANKPMAQASNDVRSNLSCTDHD
jgi:hypothetical protein